ncbi:MAG: hypothetical protein KatS3mg043_0594 [Rhodothermaceae bacterium]|nr:MAG: hypothetical protein KatS3mg043_0594 [Rhodothermaceae bacterium]
MEIVKPDYVVDLGVGGPLPILSRPLGNARFYASYREDREMYLIPLSRDSFRGPERPHQTDQRPGAGHQAERGSAHGQNDGHSQQFLGPHRHFPVSVQHRLGDEPGQLYRHTNLRKRLLGSDFYFGRNMQGLKLTHALDEASFYEVRFTRFASAYDTPARPPPGQHPRSSSSEASASTRLPSALKMNPPSRNGMRTAVGMSTARDTSRVVVWNLKGDYTRRSTASCNSNRESN